MDDVLLTLRAPALPCPSALPHLEDLLVRHRRQRARARFMLTVLAVVVLALLGLG